MVYSSILNYLDTVLARYYAYISTEENQRLTVRCVKQ